MNRHREKSEVACDDPIAPSVIRVKHGTMAAALLSLSVLVLAPIDSGLAQQASDASVTEIASETISTVDLPADDAIKARIEGIYSQIDALSAVDVAVRDGVVILSGSVSNEAQAMRAIRLAERLQGVVTVDDGINRVLDLEGNVVPLVDQFRADLTRWTHALPLVALAIFIFVVIAYAGHRLANWSSLWRRVSPNPFLGELLGQAVRIVTIVFGLVLALNLLGATALVGTILGGAGVVGLAIGFAVRDTLENYISSIMLSLRQPFRANDHVVIGNDEGKVVRLTSRATVLMTLDGNHLRIPNSQVFKAVILNYTSNPERRFTFELGVDADDDPIEAMAVGVASLSKLPFVLADPEPNAIISTMGDSNIVITFMAWVDQRASDFGKSRSLAIRSAKAVLEEAGFTLPEPIYRLRIDPGNWNAAAIEKVAQAGNASNEPTSIDNKGPTLNDPEAVEAIMDVSPDRHLEDKVNEERTLNTDSDLLDNERPIE